MAAVSETIVREYFESHEFLVRQYRKYVAPAGREDEDFDFLILNPEPQPVTGELPFILAGADLRCVARAIVVVKAWHTEIFSPALLTSSPELFRFLEKKAFQRAVAEFGRTSRALKILVLPALPRDAAAREQSIAILKSRGIDGVVFFHTMLADLVNEVSSTRNYQKSDLLQLIRILKSYDFLKEPQMELFKARRKQPRATKR
jgi:hypothetical protein